MELFDEEEADVGELVGGGDAVLFCIQDVHDLLEKEVREIIHEEEGVTILVLELLQQVARDDDNGEQDEIADGEVFGPKHSHDWHVSEEIPVKCSPLKHPLDVEPAEASAANDAVDGPQEGAELYDQVAELVQVAMVEELVAQ